VVHLGERGGAIGEVLERRERLRRRRRASARAGAAGERAQRRQRRAPELAALGNQLLDLGEGVADVAQQRVGPVARVVVVVALVVEEAGTALRPRCQPEALLHA